MADELDRALILHATDGASGTAASPTRSGFVAVPLTTLDLRHPQAETPVRGTEFGPILDGSVVVANDWGLVAVSHDGDRLTGWRGDIDTVVAVGACDAGAWAIDTLVALVAFAGRWHLFAITERARSLHLVSSDLADWQPLDGLSSSFPAFAVTGATVRQGELLLAGRVFVEEIPFGWGLLRSDGVDFTSRPVPLPLASQLRVLGPTADTKGDTMLVLDSGTTRTVARSSGQHGWTLGLLDTELVPTCVFSCTHDVWVAGHRPGESEAMLCRVGDARPAALQTDIAGGLVLAAMCVGDQLVIVRDC